MQVSSRDECEQARELSAALLEGVAKPFSIEGQEVSVGVSIGISLAPTHGHAASELLHKADLALYRVKSEGRNGFQFFQDEMHRDAQARNQLVTELRVSVARGDFELHYQPVFDAGTLRLRGMEALVRWRYPSRGLLHPDQFIGVAEENRAHGEARQVDVTTCLRRGPVLA